MVLKISALCDMCKTLCIRFITSHLGYNNDYLNYYKMESCDYGDNDIG